MKKSIGILVAATSIVLATLPTSAFAQNQPSHNSNQETFFPTADVSHDVYLAAKTNEDEDEYKGEFRYKFTYKKSDGANLRVYLEDEDERGMSLIVYDPNGNVFMQSSTSSSNSYQTLIAGQPTKEGVYLIKVVSNDGDGGLAYPIKTAARSY
ncbi:hypothetical protein M5X06_13020 [Paenibacillus alvei]|uniref:Peptidase domain protein n=1 Tax=Paenibacillus alvei TaxID=44250 RepID=A0ABT4GUR8_PAEAL|nr:hypothetical protein [Paenibacillus alvei]MCY9760443.1 hypothetical protein [Paenibacillus alvei]MCY9767735.1 hypothetical protein [Paenibacillus alvei]